MLIFVDSADSKQVETWLNEGVVDGVTTNPSIMFKDGVTDLQEGALRLCRLLGELPLCLEVTTNDRDAMLDQAHQLAALGDNIVVKIPVINEHGESCLGVIHRLSGEGLRINATALLSFNQALLAAKAGATYLSIFGGRVADEGNDPTAVIRNVRHWLDDWEFPARIIVGSIRTVMDIQNAALAGAHIITIPPQFFPKMVDHRYTRETVRQFVLDAQKTLAEMEQTKVNVAAAGAKQ